MAQPFRFGRDSLRGLSVAALAGIAVVLASSWWHNCGRSQEIATWHDGAQAMPTALAEFLGPVAPGFELGDWTIAGLGPLADGALHLELRDHTGTRVHLTLRLRDPDYPASLHETTRLALDRSTEQTPLGPAQAAAQALAPVLVEREAVAPIPPALTMRRHAPGAP